MSTIAWTAAAALGALLLAGLVRRVSARARRTARRLEAQNRELTLLQSFQASMLKPLTLGDVPASIVATAGQGLGLARAALFRRHADGTLERRASWPAAAQCDPPADYLVRQAVETRRAAIADDVAVLPVEAPSGVDHVFVAVFRETLSDAELPALRTLEIMLAGGAIALTNLGLYTEIREAHARLAAILAGVADRMLIVDTDMRIVWMNAAAAETAAESVVGRTCFTVFGVEDRTCGGCPALRALVTGKVERGVRVVAAPGGRPRYLDLVAAPLRDAAGRVYQVLEVARDITAFVEMEDRLKQSHADVLAKADELAEANHALRQAQAQLVAAERLAAVGDVIVGLHHAILNPLTGTLGTLAVLEREEGLPPGSRAALEAAASDLKRIEAIVRRLPQLRRTDGTRYVGGTTMLDLERACADRPES